MPRKPRQKAPPNRTNTIVFASLAGVVLLAAVGVGGYFALRGKNRPADNGIDNFFGAEPKKDPSSTGEDGIAAKKAGWRECPNWDKNGYKLWMPQPSTANLWPRPPEPSLAPPLLDAMLAGLPGHWETRFNNREEKTQDFYFVLGNRLDWVAPRAERQKLIRQIATERRDVAKRFRSPVTFGEVLEYVQDGFPACEIKFSGPGNDAVPGAVRFVHAGDKIFFLFAGGPTISQDSKLETFLNSFKVTHRPNDEGEDTQVSSKAGASKGNWEPEWQAVGDADGFEALMPGRATRSGNSWTWTRSGEIFSVEYHVKKSMDDVTKELESLPHPKAAALGLKHFSTWGPTPLASLPPSKRKERKEEFPTRTLVYTAPDTGSSGRAVIYDAGDRMYVVAAAVREDRNRTPKTENFVKSFKLTYKPGQPTPPAKP